MNAFELARMLQEALAEAFADIGLDDVTVKAGAGREATLVITLLNGQRFELAIKEIHG